MQWIVSFVMRVTAHSSAYFSLCFLSVFLGIFGASFWGFCFSMPLVFSGYLSEAGLALPCFRLALPFLALF
jgi:hypothetical protein